MPIHQTLKWRHFRQPTQQPNPFHPTVKSSQVRSPTLKSRQFGPPTQNSSQFACSHSIKTSDFRPADKNQVNLDHPHNNQIIFIPALKSSQTRSPSLKLSQFGPPTQKNESIFMLILKTGDFRPAYKSISTTHTTTKSISSLHWNKVKFDPPRWDQVNFDHHHENQVNFCAHTRNENFSIRIQNHHAWSILTPPRAKTSQFLSSHYELVQPGRERDSQMPFRDSILRFSSWNCLWGRFNI